MITVGFPIFYTWKMLIFGTYFFTFFFFNIKLLFFSVLNSLRLFFLKKCKCSSRVEEQGRDWEEQGRDWGELGRDHCCLFFNYL